ncbi:MAG: 2-amino-4-hydroxy-6-hydroxymethyldihydropteridine diphosphokinase [Chloroflexaceae bacterium]|nr:2-amino-4-hydroxy-6-hydroxymethyldihydropteridine diphosphokinase [Chloroflexaceae bacterium]
MNEAILSVGSNINPVENLRRAAAILAEEQTWMDSSKIIITKPVGYQYQPDFHNAAFYLKTRQDYLSFNESLKRVEIRLGRVKTVIKSGPRTIDLDIIIWNGYIVRDEFYYHDYVSGPTYELVHKHGITLQCAAPTDHPARTKQLQLEN